MTVNVDTDTKTGKKMGIYIHLEIILSEILGFNKQIFKETKIRNFLKMHFPLRKLAYKYTHASNPVLVSYQQLKTELLLDVNST